MGNLGCRQIIGSGRRKEYPRRIEWRPARWSLWGARAPWEEREGDPRWGEVHPGRRKEEECRDQKRCLHPPELGLASSGV